MWTLHNQYTVDNINLYQASLIDSYRITKDKPHAIACIHRARQAVKIINLFAASFTLKRTGLMG